MTWTNASLLPAKPIVERWWGVIVRWHLPISSHFLCWSIQLVLSGQKCLLNQWTSTLHWHFTEVSHLPIMGFEFEAVSDKLLHETYEEEEECTKPRKQTQTIQQPFKKGFVGISESSTHNALFLEKVFFSLWSRMTLAEVNKISHPSVVGLCNWRCEFTHYSYKMNDR